MYSNKIVARYSDGRLQKGTFVNFLPGDESFHIMPEGTSQKDKLMSIRCKDLKAVFFVRDFVGNPHYEDKKEFEPGKLIIGRKVLVLFKDGEQIVGTTNAYAPNRSGFFVLPADTRSNIQRCFVVTKATSAVKMI